MKLLALTLMLALSMGMGSRPVRTKPAPLPQNPPVEAPKEPSPTIEAPAGTVTVTAKISGKAEDAKRIERLGSLTPLVQEVLNDPRFEARMLKAWYDGKAGFASSSDSPAQVIAKLKASPWSQVYEFDSAVRSTLGWTYPSTKTVWFNRRNFDGREDCGLVGTRFHEETHKRGYGHDDKTTKRRPFSVPYYTGTQASEICNEIKANKLAKGKI